MTDEERVAAIEAAFKDVPRDEIGPLFVSSLVERFGPRDLAQVISLTMAFFITFNEEDGGNPETSGQQILSIMETVMILVVAARKVK